VGDRSWIVVPCFNEAARLDHAAFETAMASPDAPHFLFVDDGSTDETWQTLEALRERSGERCHLLSLPENRGKAEAVRAGLRAALDAGAERVGYWDADLSTPLGVIEDFRRELDARPDAEVIMGARVRMLGRRIQRHGYRHLVGRFYATIASLVLRLPVYDTQCGAKLFRSSPALSAALERPFRSRWAFDVELLQRLQRAWGHSGLGTIVELPLSEWRDVGQSKVSLRAGGQAFLFLIGLALRRPSHGQNRSPVAGEREVSRAIAAETDR
jgi:dolichyl-phosphate beta-glucosyltransferase